MDRKENNVDKHGVLSEVARANCEEQSLKYETIVCREEGITDFVSLIECIDEKKDIGVFVAFGEKEVINGLRNTNSKIILIKAGNEAVAGGIVWFPDVSDADGDGKNIGLSDGGYAQIDNTVVKKEYRGYGLQAELIKLSCQIAFEAGINTVLATVSEKNPHSYRNFEKLSFKFVKNIKFRTADRRLYRRDLCDEKNKTGFMS